MHRLSTASPVQRRLLRAGEDMRLLAPALLAWGILAVLLPLTTDALAGAAGGALVVALLALLPRAGWARWVALAAAVTCVTLGAAAGHVAVREAGPLTESAAGQRTVELEGTLAAEPHVRPARNAGEGRDLVIVRVVVDRVVAAGQTREVRSPVLVLGDGAWAQRHWRDRVRFTARLRPAEAGDDIVAVALARDVRLVATAPPPLRLASGVRDGLRAACADLPPDAAGLVPGLAVGDTRGQPADLDDAMRETSLTHLSAVSGSNIALVVGFVGLACGWVGVPRRARVPVCLTALAAYVTLCGLEPSVIRAGVMGGIALLGLLRSRKRSSLPALGAAVVVLLCWDPWLARSPGFALSCLATLALVVLARPWADAARSHLPKRLGWLGEAVAVPLAAQVLCAPVVVALSGRLPVVALVANLLAAPFVAPVTVLGLAAAVVAVAWVPAAAWVAWAAALPALAIAWVARTLAEVPLASLPWPAAWWGVPVLAALTVLLLVTGRWLARRAGRHPVVIALAVVLVLTCLLPLGRTGPPPDGWALVACDVGQGDAVVLAGAEPGHAVLVDTGPPEGAVLDCLDRLGVTVLDAMVLTHFHDDHAGRAVDVLGHTTVRQVVVTGLAEPRPMAEAVSRAAVQAGAPVRVAQAGDRIEVPGAELAVLGPSRLHEGESGINDASLVLAVTVRGTRVLVTGDLEPRGAQEVRAAVQAEVAAHGGFDVLKVPHHGSRKQDEGLVCATGAGQALVSVGVGNDFGHPAPATLSLLQRCGLAVERTDEHGDLAYYPGGAVVGAR